MSVVTLGSNIASFSAQRRLAEGTDLLSRTFERLSSGQRINRASDDAAGLAIADSLRADSRVFAQGVRNLNDGISLLNIADGAIEQLSQITIRLVELAEQAANGTYSHVQRKALDSEAQALSKEFLRISRSTSFNGLSLFDGTVSEIRLQGGYGIDGGINTGVGGALGSGSFSSPQFYNSGNKTNNVQVADLNGNGILDMVLSDMGSATVSVLLGNGDGTFAQRTSYSIDIGTSESITLGDFNGNGVIDIAAVSTNTNSVRILYGQGDGSFISGASYLVGNNPHSVKAGDLNGDGILDLVTANYDSNSVSILIGQPDGTFTSAISSSAGSNPDSVSIGDFNGDGIMDLVTSSYYDSRLYVLIGNGDGSFAAPISYTTGGEPLDVKVADFNNDGILDIATANESNSVSILLGRGDGTFSPHVSYAIGSDPRSISIGDFNGDGIPDIVSADTASQTISVLIGQGDGTFLQRTSYHTGSQINPRSVTVGDLNGDGILDIVSATGGGGITYASVFLGEKTDGIAPILPFSLQTMADARQALPMLGRKRDQLAAQRGQIGAFQARVNVAASTLSSARENFLAAESRIRDADMAVESANLVRLNILQQASSSVLAQANLQPALAILLLNSDE